MERIDDHRHSFAFRCQIRRRRNTHMWHHHLPNHHHQVVHTDPCPLPPPASNSGWTLSYLAQLNPNLPRSRKSHKKSPFFNRTFPPDNAFASKKTKGRTNSVLRTASFVARYCFRNASFSEASLARAALVCALACTATELEGFRRFFMSEGVGPPSSSPSSCCAVVVEVVFFDFTLGSCASSLLRFCSVVSSSSSPNESPIFFNPFFRFLKPAGLGVCSLYLVRQFLFSMRRDATRA
jgi:hypothetical protein